MKATKRIIYFVLVAAVVVLEALPYGAVLIFAPGPGQTARSTTSYFDLLPFGYANFGPLLTAILSVCMLALLLLSFFIKRRGLLLAVFVLNIPAVLTSLMPLIITKPVYWSGVGVLISLLLVGGLFAGALAFTEKSKGNAV